MRVHVEATVNADHASQMLASHWVVDETEAALLIGRQIRRWLRQAEDLSGSPVVDVRVHREGGERERRTG